MDLNSSKRITLFSNEHAISEFVADKCFRLRVPLCDPAWTRCWEQANHGIGNVTQHRRGVADFDGGSRFIP